MSQRRSAASSESSAMPNTSQRQVKRKTNWPPFTDQELQNFLGEKPSDVLFELVKNKEKCESLLNQDKLSENTLLLTLRVMSSLCYLDPVGISVYIKDLIIVISIIESSSFLSKHLTRYLVSLPIRQTEEINGEDSTQGLADSDLGMILELLKLFLQHKPRRYTEVGGALILVERVTPGGLMEELQQLKTSYNSVEQDQKTAKQRAMEKQPPNNFRDIPIFPESTEIRQVTKPFLRKNIVQGRYENVEHYLDVQFRLLREDFVAPLREGVTEFLSDTTGRPQDIRMYYDVSIQNRTLGENGFVYTLKFDIRPLKRVRWEASKRLLYGSFVCLTRDKFKHILCATVENRKPQDLEKGLVDVRFLGDAALTKGPFIMAESAAYFEAYRHVLQGLQQMNDCRFPFKKYIVNVDSSVKPPSYLHDYHDIRYNLSLLAGEEYDWNVSHVPILHPESWPCAGDLHLDESQKAALQAALTREFAIIQGPPGTGKTYIGLKIIELLLKNNEWKLDIDESPILVVCYTNHALDQFLEGIVAFGEDSVVRVGSRSSSEQLEKKNLSRLRRERPRQGLRHDDRKALRETDEAIQSCLYKLDIPTKVLLNVEALKEYMSHGEYFALSHRRQKGEPPEEQADKLLHWLNVVDLKDGSDHNHPFHQYQPKQIDGNERIDVEDEGYRIQRERQIDDSYGRRSREERKQILKDKTFRTYAAYPQGNSKRCGKGHNSLPVVELQKPDVMTDEEAGCVERVWSLMIWDRWRLYRLWVKRYMEDQEEKLNEHRKRYEELSKVVQDINVVEDLRILQEANVIGMTTTGAAKHRAVLQRLGPRIVVVEEAAEVLEAHIITTLTAKCQHLILIGDHQQLKPNPTVYRLAKIFNLDTSLFERMINNGMPCQSLTHQHRMRPEISTLMKKHFYNNLHDDESVLNMDDVKGVAHNMFFIDHQHLEDEDDDDRTKSNQYEAEVLVELCRYLLRQGYEPSQITVLTTYTGQLFCFRRLMDKATFKGVRVCVVDNFQGEENDIILLSLVRSNEGGSIGFLKTSNRVCVALSRARMGFYCICNASILKKAPIWQGIIASLEAENRIGLSLTLVCQNHPNKITQVATAHDFKGKVPCGGCDGPCEYRLPCGHVCSSLCHPDNPKHEDYKCDKPCIKLCIRSEHMCPLRCHQSCRPCQKKVQRTMSDCGHVIQVSCHEFDDVTCTEQCQMVFAVCRHHCPRTCGQSCPETCPVKCESTLPCGHPCTQPCGKPCTKICFVKVERTLPKCGHKVSMDCSVCPGDFNCVTRVTKILPKCGHRVQMFCFEDPNCSECKERCTKTLRCRHPCPNICGKPCEMSDSLRESNFDLLHTLKKCSSPCERFLKCGHRCSKKCSETCTREKLPDAGFPLRSYSDFCGEKCGNVLSCGHKCPNKCGEPCPGTKMGFTKQFDKQVWTKCQEYVQKKLSKCDHTVRARCDQDVSSFFCFKNCERKLPCGHRCPNKCSEPCPGQLYHNMPRPPQRQRPQTPRTRCEVITKNNLACGHSTKSMPCWKAESAANIPCREPCRDELGCGHKCHGDCDSCKQGTQHKPCTKTCNRQLLCGHNCNEACGNVCSPDCRRCRDGTRPSTSQDLTDHQPCHHNIRHSHLKTNACIRSCNQELQCKHPCVGVCGEPCPPFCNVCDKKSVRTNLPKGRIQSRGLFIYLSDCKHLCEMRSLDRMFAAAKNSLENGFFQIHFLLCPKCKEPIRNCPRYDNILKIINESVDIARRKCLANKRDVFAVSNAGRRVVRHTSTPVKVGGWMRCRHGHVLYQDDVEEHPEQPRCPECSQ